VKLILRRYGLFATVAATMALLIGTATPAAALPAFGTAPVVVAPPNTSTTITAVRVGQNVGFDRVVFDIGGPLPGYRVSYVPQVTEEGSGKPVPLAGAADILVTLSHTEWLTTPSPSVNVSTGFPGLRQVRSAGEFEAQASYGIGQATKAGFRVFTLTAPNRVVIDVRHP
jgi:hypothetical protein